MNKSEFNFSYSRSHFSRLPKAVSEGPMNCLSKKVSYSSMMIDTFINGFSPNEVRSHFHICDNLILTFEKRVLMLTFYTSLKVNG